jgi:hypothetical protein
MKDRITRELNYLRFRMLLKVTDNTVLTVSQKNLVMALLRTTVEEVEKERLTIYGFPFKTT